ncbi:MAG: nucleotidyltransferase domain-containing protein [Phycisphaerales bacterium]|nr:nucleotidyltransferase domain-containing protein [Phycisphaerales bacterium]
MEMHGVMFPEDQIAAFCERHHVRSLRVFGSILRPDFSNASDVDLLVEFEPGQTPGMVGFGEMIIELRAMLRRDVDLRTPADLSRHFLPAVLRVARTLHAA